MKSHKMEKSLDEMRNRINGGIYIAITVVGCLGKFKFLVKQDDLVLDVIGKTLKSYARQKWFPQFFPQLRCNAEDFVLCQARNSCLSPTETIGSCGGRHFILKMITNAGIKGDKPKPESLEMKSHKIGKSLEEMRDRINGGIYIVITVVGCAGKFKFLVKQDDLVSDVIEKTLKSHARQGFLPQLLPHLRCNVEDFVLLQAPNSCLSLTETIGSCGGRHFILMRMTNVGLKGDKPKAKSFNWKFCTGKSVSSKSRLLMLNWSWAT